MLAEVYALNYSFVALLANHLEIVAMLIDRDQLQCRKSYVVATFFANKTAKI